MRTNPFRKIYDACNEGDSKQKFENLPPFPRLIDIEATNACNFRCLMCPTGNRSMKRKTGMMSQETFDKILDECAKWNCAIRWVQWGENDMHSDLFAHIRAAHDRGVLTHLNTNGSKLTPERIRELIDTGLDSIKFSFQGVDQQSYKEMRNTDFFEELIQVISNFHAARGDSPVPYIQLSTTITYEDEETVAEFRRRTEPIADLVSIGRTVFDNLDLSAVRLKPEEIERLHKLKSQESVIKVHPECPEVFDKMSIFWDGAVSACCADADKKMPIGDVNQNTMEEIWNSDAMNHYRAMLADMRHDELELCSNCYDYQSLSKAGLQGL